ncbi:MAG: preprotein translocase subunit SecY [Oscillospiraceae bacterium]|nr:preprotein translocase subunit SecY [Oscillospiraceae bacterium]
MLKTIRNAWKLPDLRKKIIFTGLILLIYRVGNAVPVPYIDASLLSTYFTSLENTVLGLYNAMSGGAFASATIFALSIQPYINSSIIIQLLCVAIPALERMSKEEGEEGKKKIEKITRFLTIGLGLLMGFGYYMLISRNNLLSETGVWPAFVIILTFAAGSTFIMWLGEQINEFGIGNGISIILFASIVSRVPKLVTSLFTYTRNYFLRDSIENATVYTPWGTALIIIGILAIMVFIIFISDAECRLPVSYAKRVVGRKVYGGQSTHLPMKVNMSGVMPIIFAQSIASLPATAAAFFPQPAEGTFWYAFLNAIDTHSALYIVCYFLLIIAFSYFYATIQFNPVEVANNLRKSGGFIPGFRPGRPTAEFIRKVLNKITLFGAIYLGIVAIMPILAGKVVDTTSLSLGGTSLIIVVGVALETVKSLENQMLMRHYKGFLE